MESKLAPESFLGISALEAEPSPVTLCSLRQREPVGDWRLGMKIEVWADCEMGRGFELFGRFRVTNIKMDVGLGVLIEAMSDADVDRFRTTIVPKIAVKRAVQELLDIARSMKERA